jgi:transposase
MRPIGTSQELNVRRQIGLRLLERGMSAEEVADAVEVSRQSVHAWKRAAANGEWIPPKHSGGSKPRLNPKQMKQLERWLDQGAPANGFVGDYWTSGRIAELIRKRLGASYSPSGVTRMLKKAGWSWQKPQRVPVQRDDEAVKYWARRVMPRIKKGS